MTSTTNYTVVFSLKCEPNENKSIEVVEAKRQNGKMPFYFIRIVLSYENYNRSISVNPESLRALCDYMWSKEPSYLDVFKLDEEDNKRIIVTAYTPQEFYIVTHSRQGLEAMNILISEEWMINKALAAATKFRKQTMKAYYNSIAQV
jgi:hypothetical protein